jgi:hypothetical protein
MSRRPDSDNGLLSVFVGTTMRTISPAEIQEIYDTIADCLARHRFRIRCDGRLAEDRDEAHHSILITLIDRAGKHWDGVRPLAAYVGASAPKEIQKFQNRSRRYEAVKECK